VRVGEQERNPVAKTAAMVVEASSAAMVEEE
jgi:hypothetical protein